MKIEIWSDYICPFCYIGKKRLEQALNQMGIKDHTEIIYRSFELDPNFPKESEDTIDVMISKKYSIPLEEARKANEGVIQMAKETGLDYHFENMHPANTLDLHRINHYAQEVNRATEFSEKIFRHYFTQSGSISDQRELIRVAMDAGLDKSKVTQILKSDLYLDEVRIDEAKGSELGIRSVPHFIFNEKISLSGAQPVEVFIKAMERAKTIKPSEGQF